MVTLRVALTKYASSSNYNDASVTNEAIIVIGDMEYKRSYRIETVRLLHIIKSGYYTRGTVIGSSVEFILRF